MASISTLFVELKLSAENFNNGLRDAQREAKEFDKTIRPTKQMLQDVGSAMTGVGVAITAIGLPFAMAAKSAIDTADAFDEMSQRTGASVEALSSVTFFLQKAGGSADDLEKSIRASSKVIEDAATGNKAAAETLAQLGLSVEELLAMKPDERFFAIAKSLDEIQDASLKSAQAQEIFGKGGTALIPVLADLAKGQANVEAEAAKLNQRLSGEGAASAGRFNDALQKVKDAFGGIMIALVDSGLLDIIAFLATRVAMATGEFIKAHPIITTVGAALGVLAAVVGPLIAGVGLLVSGVAGLIPVFTSISTLVGGAAGVSAALASVGAVLTGPVGIVAAIIAATAALSAFVIKNETLNRLLSPIWDAVASVINGTIDLIKKAWDALWNFIIDAPRRAKEAIVGAVTGITDKITGAFASMYDAVVGNSFVPDMLDRIQEEFGRLGDVMGTPTMQATDMVTKIFSDMFTDVLGKAGGFSNALGQIMGSLAGGGGGGIGSILGTLGAANPYVGAAMAGFNIGKAIVGLFSGGNRGPQYERFDPGQGGVGVRQNYASDARPSQGGDIYLDGEKVGRVLIPRMQRLIREEGLELG
jgi:hypothetical protein